MNNSLVHNIKTILFILAAVCILSFGIEFSARVILCVKRGLPAYLLYGLKAARPQQRFQKHTGKDGVIYYKAIPSDEKNNPVNSIGFRGAEIHQKRQGTIRVLCMGGSTTYGSVLDYNETYPFLLQQRLGRDRYEVINCGEPYMSLLEIISMTQDNGLDESQPDIILLMSIANNMRVPGCKFVIMDDPDQDKRDKAPLQNRLARIRRLLVRRLAFALLFLDIKKEIIDYGQLAECLMAPGSPWVPHYQQNLARFVALFFKKNPAVQIFLLDEAYDFKKDPQIEGPFSRAKEILREACAQHDRIHCVDLQAPVFQAYLKGEKVWNLVTDDGMHLSKRGNEIIAETVAALLANLTKK